MSTSLTTRPAGRSLSWRAEARRQWGRRRTRWVLGILGVLPLLLVGAFALNGGSSSDGGSGGGNRNLVSVATHGSQNFAMFVFVVSANLLLPILGAVLVGDPVPAEASWSSLRYLLTAPVGRLRLLTSKLVVGLAAFSVSAFLLPMWALLVGVVAYGNHGFLSPTGFAMSTGMFIGHAALAIAYTLITLMPVAALAFWLGVRTDAPLGAVGGAVLALVVCGIVDTIEALGGWRDALLGHFSMAFFALFSPGPVDYTDMIHGVLWALVWTVVFLALAFRGFVRKDVLS